MNQTTNTPHIISLPGGGFLFKSKLTLEISAGAEVIKMKAEQVDTNYVMDYPTPNNGVEILNISNGRGDQTPQNFPIVVVWGSKAMKSSGDIFITPGEVDLEGGHAMIFLVAEVKTNVDKNDWPLSEGYHKHPFDAGSGKNHRGTI